MQAYLFSLTTFKCMLTRHQLNAHVESYKFMSSHKQGSFMKVRQGQFCTQKFKKMHESGFSWPILIYTLCASSCCDRLRFLFYGLKHTNE